MTIEPPDPARDPERAPGLQDEFWGEQAEWVATERRPSRQRGGLGVSARRWWGGLLGAGTHAERVHGEVSAARGHEADDDRATDPSTPDRFDDDIDHTDRIDEGLDDGWTFEVQPQLNRRAGVDPLLARFGGLAVIATLAVPMVMGFVSEADEGLSNSPSSAAAIAPLAENTPVAPSVEGAASSGVDSPTATPTTPATVAGNTTTQIQVDPPVAAALEESVSDDTELAESDPIDTAAPCGNRYELVAGDYWIRIADGADVSLADLLDVNEASVDTVLVPGRSICLPVGASTPAPPATAAPTTTPARASSSAGAVAASTPRTTAVAATPSTTVPPAPTTTAPARPPAVPVAEAVAIIREVWPDELEERAIEIAWRESNHRSNVNNSCCYGLFQIHWTAHRSWLGSVGVTSAFDLYDPRLNTVAAYQLYQRAGGFGPWGG